MKLNRIKDFTFLLVCLPLIMVILFSSCARQRDLVNYKARKLNHKVYSVDSIIQYKLIRGDKLDIQVINNTGESIDIFNKQVSGKQEGESSASLQLQGYDIDQAGCIELPMVGKIHVEGKTIDQADSLIESKLAEYLAFAYVKTALLSFRITFLGEFRAPQTVVYPFTEINLLQGVGLAGDFTDYADRDQVKVYRKNSRGEYEMHVIDLSVDDIFSASQFQLQPNDVVYAPPMKVKVVKLNAPTVTVMLSIVTFTILILGFSKTL